MQQRLVRLPAQALAVFGFRVEPVGVEQVGSDHLGHLFLAERRREVFGGRQVLLPPLALRQGLVGDMPQQVLQEGVLALLRRPRVRLQPEHLTPHHAGQQPLQLLALETAQRGERLRRERLAQHGCVAEQPSFLGREPVETGSDEGVQRLGDLERVDLAHELVGRTFLHEKATVEQHPHRLDGVQRDAFGPFQDLLAQLRRQPRHQTDEQLLHSLRGERLEVERGEVAVPRAPGRPLLEELGPRQRDHEQRLVARPLEQVLDEVEQRGICPLHVLEGEDRRVRVGQTLEEQAPGCEKVLPLLRSAFAEREQLREPGLDEAPLLRIEQVLLERCLQLLQRHLRPLVLGDPAAPPHHVRQRPVGHALAVREAAAAMPVDRLDDPVEVLVELPREPRLADPGDPGHRHQLRPPLLRRDVEKVLDLPQLAVTADERRLQTLRLQRPLPPRDDAQRTPQRRLTLLALQLEAASGLVDDRSLGRSPRPLADEDRPGLGDRLHPRSGVDEVARHHPLAHRGCVDRGLAREHACAHPQSVDPGLLAQRLHRSDEIERRTNSSLRVVLRRHRRPPHRHDGVADELLHDPAVQPYEAPTGVEVAGEELAHLLRVARLRQGREAHQVREKHRHEPAFRDRRLDRGGGGRRRGRRSGERGAAVAAKALIRVVWSPAGRALELGREGPAAADAELPSLAILASAGAANRHG